VSRRVHGASVVDLDHEARHRVEVRDVDDATRGSEATVRHRPVGEFDRLGSQHGASARPLDGVGRGDESGGELGRRSLVGVGRWCRLLDAVATKHRELVAHREGLLLVVRDVDGGDADLSFDAFELRLQLLAKCEVERAERFVEQQHLRFVHDGARERDALALSTRQRRTTLREIGHLDHVEDGVDARVSLGLGDLAYAHAAGHVLGPAVVGRGRSPGRPC
jgi:hypothetical protein